MFLYEYRNEFVGYFSLEVNGNSAELNNCPFYPSTDIWE